MLASIRSLYPWRRHVFADGAYAGNTLRQAMAKHGNWAFEIIRRSDAGEGFVLLPRRWVVERTFVWRWRCRRLSEDFEATIDEFELAYHRVVARRLLHDPSMVERAAEKIDDGVRHPDLRDRWRELLASKPVEGRRFITSRSQTFYHMRIESPFRIMDLVGDTERMRLLRIAKWLTATHERTPTSSMWSASWSGGRECRIILHLFCHRRRRAGLQS